MGLFSPKQEEVLSQKLYALAARTGIQLKVEKRGPLVRDIRGLPAKYLDIDLRIDVTDRLRLFAAVAQLRQLAEELTVAGRATRTPNQPK